MSDSASKYIECNCKRDDISCTNTQKSREPGKCQRSLNLWPFAEVGSVVLHMCAFGITSTDEQGEAPVKKGTRLMSSSDEVLKRVDRKCSNGGNGTQHRQVHLIQGVPRPHRSTPKNWLTVYARE